MDNIEKIEKLLKKRNGIITTSEVEELGVNSRILTNESFSMTSVFKRVFFFN